MIASTTSGEGAFNLADGRLELHPHLFHRIPENLAAWYTVAAAVCLSRHRDSPVDYLVATRGEEDVVTYATEWDVPTEDERGNFNSMMDATEYGAYCVALAAAHAHLGRVVLRRAEDGTGSDWNPAPAQANGPPDLNWDEPDLIRLEVSGSIQFRG